MAYMSDKKPFQMECRSQFNDTIRWSTLLVVLLLAFFLAAKGFAESSGKETSGTIAERAAGSLTKGPSETWTFAMSADSRDCGNVVMPAIAAGVLAHDAAFYWHLGDFRYGEYFDEDMNHEVRYVKKQKHPMRFGEYEANNWNDFIENQLLPFGKVPVLLAIGNHELYFKTRQDYLIEFANWLNTTIIRKQRLKDNPTDFRLRTYYHWVMGGVDFLSLDNASGGFDKDQMQWIETVLKRDEADPRIHSIVVGMHVPLPHSLAKNDMGDSVVGAASGERVYKELLAAERMHKRVYILNSHEHLYMANAYNSEYWKSHGGVLQGWTVGTAGAIRDNLPKDYAEASAAKARVYGYLLGTVNPSGTAEGTISFQYHWVEESDVPKSVVDKFVPTPGFVSWCFKENYRGGKPVPPVPAGK